MSNVTKKSKRAPDSRLVEAFLSIIEPVRALQNDNPLRLNDPAVDTGHETPAMKDKTFAFILSGMAQTAHNQLYGQLVAGDGRKFDNAKTWLDNSRKRRDNIEKDLTDVNLPREENFNIFITSSDWILAQHYVETNEAKCQALQELIDACASAYRILTNEDWQPRTQKVAETSVRKIEVTPEMAAKALADLRRRTARTA